MIRPDYAEAYYTLGTVLKQQGQFTGLRKFASEAIRLQPDFAGAHTHIGGRTAPAWRRRRRRR